MSADRLRLAYADPPYVGQVRQLASNQGAVMTDLTKDDTLKADTGNSGFTQAIAPNSGHAQYLDYFDPHYHSPASVCIRENDLHGRRELARIWLYDPERALRWLHGACNVMRRKDGRPVLHLVEGDTR